MSTSTRTPPPDEIREIARVAIAHERTVERRLLGRHVRGAVSDRVDAELARRGYIDAPRATSGHR
jgi:hypothetical protein